MKTHSPTSDCGTRTLSFGQLEIKVNYHVAGLVASVQDPTVDETFYRQKAWTSQFVYPDWDPELVVVADDSSRNTRYFQEDLKRANLFSVAKEIKIFELTQVNGEEDIQ